MPPGPHVSPGQAGPPGSRFPCGASSLAARSPVEAWYGCAWTAHTNSITTGAQNCGRSERQAIDKRIFSLRNHFHLKVMDSCFLATLMIIVYSFVPRKPHTDPEAQRNQLLLAGNPIYVQFFERNETLNGSMVAVPKPGPQVPHGSTKRHPKTEAVTTSPGRRPAPLPKCSVFHTRNLGRLRGFV